MPSAPSPDIPDWVYSVAFSPDGTTALSGSRDDTLILWDIASWDPIRTFSGHSGDVWSVAFSPDGTTALFRISGQYPDLMGYCQRRSHPHLLRTFIFRVQRRLQSRWHDRPFRLRGHYLDLMGYCRAGIPSAPYPDIVIGCKVSPSALMERPPFPPHLTTQ